MTYQVIYIPKIQDEVVVASYDNKQDAENWMEHIAQVNPMVLKHHYIKEVK
jgi:hypothetical protein